MWEESKDGDVWTKQTHKVIKERGGGGLNGKINGVIRCNHKSQEGGKRFENSTQFTITYSGLYCSPASFNSTFLFNTKQHVSPEMLNNPQILHTN